MSVPAVKKTPRKVFIKLHRWTGLLLLAFLFIAGFTGAAISFRGELERIINPHLFVVEPSAKARPYAEIITTACKILPRSSTVSADASPITPSKVIPSTPHSITELVKAT